MERSYLFDAEKNIYYKKISGRVSYNEAIESLQDSSFYDITKNIYLVEDTRDAVYDFPLKKLYAFVNKSQKNLPKKILIFQAIITNSKELVVFGSIFKTMLSNHRFKLGIFSDPKKAEKWITQKQKVFGTTVPI
jgi:hypothetical protein